MLSPGDIGCEDQALDTCWGAVSATWCCQDLVFSGHAIPDAAATLGLGVPSTEALTETRVWLPQEPCQQP